MTNFGPIVTAMVTPFNDDGTVNYKQAVELMDYLIQNKSSTILLTGTTGECPTLSHDEEYELYQLAVKYFKGKVNLMAGTGSNCTKTAITSTQMAQEIGMDSILQVVPYYNKPPQRGLVAHFESIAEKSRTPVVMYNVPGRTIQSLSAESIGELSKHPNISGLKESTGDLEFLKKILNVVPKDFCLLSGDDGTAVDFCLNGGDGVIGVVTHLIPNQFSSWIRRAREKDPQASVELKGWMDLIDGIYVEANPIPVKAALQKMGIFQSAELRLPLVELDQKFQKGLQECLENHQLI